MYTFEAVVQYPAPLKARTPSLLRSKLGTAVGLSAVFLKIACPVAGSVAIYASSVLKYFPSSK